MPTVHQLNKGARVTKHFRSKTPAFRGCPQKRGTILRIDITKPKKPNSAKRQIAKVRLSNKREIMAYIPGFGHKLSEHASVLVRGGRCPDVPGVRYHLFRKKLDFTTEEKVARSQRRSKYGIKNPNKQET